MSNDFLFMVGGRCGMLRRSIVDAIRAPINGHESGLGQHTVLEQELSSQIPHRKEYKFAHSHETPFKDKGKGGRSNTRHKQTLVVSLKNSCCVNSAVNSRSRLFVESFLTQCFSCRTFPSPHRESAGINDDWSPHSHPKTERQGHDMDTTRKEYSSVRPHEHSRGHLINRGGAP